MEATRTLLVGWMRPLKPLFTLDVQSWGSPGGLESFYGPAADHMKELPR